MRPEMRVLGSSPVRRLTLFCVLAVTLSLAAATSASAAPIRTAGTNPKIDLVTYNLYTGATLDRLQGALTPDQLISALTELWQTVQSTDFNERAQAIAAQIASVNPDIVAVQEAMIWKTQAPSDELEPNPTDATTVAYDYLELLRAALASRGLNYTVVKVTKVSEEELPIPALNIDVRFVDRLAILARSGVTTSDVRDGTYVSRYAITSSLAPPIPIPRAWQSLETTVGGETVRIVNTLLEPADPPTQEAQADELRQVLGTGGPRTILAGTLGSVKNGMPNGAYSYFTDRGYTDAWSAVNPSDPGPTCCQAPDLKNASSELSERSDQFMARGYLEATRAELLGESAADRTPSGLWPARHAGLFASFDVTQPPVDVDTSVDAQLVKVTATARRVTVRLTSNEPVVITLELRRKTKVLAKKTTARLVAGDRALFLVIPKGTAPGKAKLTVRFKDDAGNRLRNVRSVAIPRK